MENIKVSLLILTYNNKNILKNLLNSIEKNTKYSNYDVFIIDNGGIDGTDEMVKKRFKNFKLIKINENKSFIGGFNEGFKRIKHNSDYYAFICDDIYILTENWLSKLVKSLQKPNNMGAVFPIEIIPPEFSELLDKDNKTRLISDFLKNKLTIYENWFKNKEPEQDEYNQILEGPCYLIKKQVLQKTGLFEPLLFPAYTEDIDLGLKILRAGYDVARNNNVGIIHFHSLNFNSILQKNEKRLLVNRNRIIQGIMNRCLKNLIRQVWFEFKTLLYDIFKLGISIKSIYNSYIYILKNLKRIYQARLFRKFLYKSAKNKEFYNIFRKNNLSKAIFQPPIFDVSKIVPKK
jgi:hypothetical protein